MTTSALDQTLTDGDRETRDTIGTGRPFAWLLMICGALGTLASFVITEDKFKLPAATS